MSFGRNPHVAKAQAAEQKAQLARDESARTLAWREAARQWERAADRENSDARRQEYADRAQVARDEADGRVPTDDEPLGTGAPDQTQPAAAPAPVSGRGSEPGDKKEPPHWLN